METTNLHIKEYNTIDLRKCDDYDGRLKLNLETVDLLMRVPGLQEAFEELAEEKDAFEPITVMDGIKRTIQDMERSMQTHELANVFSTLSNIDEGTMVMCQIDDSDLKGAIGDIVNYFEENEELDMLADESLDELEADTYDEDGILNERYADRYDSRYNDEYEYPVEDRYDDYDDRY